MGLFSSDEWRRIAEDASVRKIRFSRFVRFGVSMIFNLFSVRRLVVFTVFFVVLMVLSHWALGIKRAHDRHVEYANLADKTAQMLAQLIEAKSESNLLIALALAHDGRYVEAIKAHKKPDFTLDRFADVLREVTPLKNVWIQLSDARGISLYRSWTSKRGDDLKKIRKDMVQMVDDPKIMTAISTGLFDMTFKSMVPLFDGGRHVGTIEVISKFNSIAEKLVAQGVEPVILVDRSYRTQMTKPFTKTFVDNYYVANLNADPGHLAYIKARGVQTFVDPKTAYLVDEAQQLFISFYHLPDVHRMPMGHFILFHSLSGIDLGAINFFHYAMLGLIAFLATVAYLVVIVLSFRHSREKSELEKQLLALELDETKGELAEQHTFLRQVIDGVHDSVMVIDREYNVLLYNRNAAGFGNRNLFEKPAKCYEVSHNQDLPCDGEHHPCPLHDAFEAGTTVKMVHEHTATTGEPHYVELTSTPLYDTKGQMYAIIETGHDITAHLQAQKLLEMQKDALDYQAHYDALTELPNRVLFYDRLSHAIDHAGRRTRKLAVIFIDLDHFKEVNDSLGHDAGDFILKETAERMKKHLRKSDTVARLGGDEFTILMEEFDDVDEIAMRVISLIERIRQPFHYRDFELYSGASVGISLFPDNGNNAGTLVKNADAAMYRSKAKGRNTYSFYTQELTQRAYARISMEATLRKAIGCEAFVMYYQPQIDLQSGEIRGYEALIRLPADDGGMVPPGEFIPLAEQSGLILEIGQLVLKMVFAQAREWRTHAVPFERLALNLSTKQLQQMDFLSQVRILLAQTHCRPEWIEFEITESYLLEDLDMAIDVIRQIKAMGIIVSLDDFATGYSSLTHLKRIPFDTLKIDKSFVGSIPENPKDMAIASSIIALAGELGITVIAEGVETRSQYEWLAEQACDVAQGYYFSPPRSVEATERGQ